MLSVSFCKVVKWFAPRTRETSQPMWGPPCSYRLQSQMCLKLLELSWDHSWPWLSFSPLNLGSKWLKICAQLMASAQKEFTVLDRWKTCGKHVENMWKQCKWLCNQRDLKLLGQPSNLWTVSITETKCLEVTTRTVPDSMSSFNRFELCLYRFGFGQLPLWSSDNSAHAYVWQ